MKRALLCSAFAALLTGCGLCPSPPSAATGTAARYPITDVATAPATPVRNQAKSGTCWAFGGVSLIESEAIRTRRCTLDLSEMWVVRHAYFEKAVKYVRTRGRVAFDQGGEIQDVLWLVDRYGIVPQSLYEGGAADGTYDHASLAKAIRRLAKRIVDKKLYEKEHWQRMIDEELDRRLGARPDRFVIDGVAYTPFSYADSIGFRRDDYIALTSFTHHPFFERFVLEIPDNWAAHATLNIPLDSLMRLLDSALAAGYTAAWGGDVSERGFGRRAGIALLPQQEGRITLPAPEIVVDQPLRQRMFDTQATTDDHVMHIVGTAVDSLGNSYYKVKNSWGERAGRHGYWYASPAYVAGKTIELVLPRAALGVDPGDDAFRIER